MRLKSYFRHLHSSLLSRRVGFVIDEQLGTQDVDSAAAAYASRLRRCGNAKALTEGRSIHAEIAGSSGLSQDRLLSNLLIEMYGKCGSVQDAQAVFDKMPRRNVFSWTMMIASYAQNGHYGEALQLFGKMDMEGASPDRVVFLGALDACASLGSLAEAKIVHGHLVECGFESDVAVGNTLVNMYGKCGSVEEARHVFDCMQQRSMVSWTAMISAYAQNGHYSAALELFQKMDLEGKQPNEITFTSILEACANLKNLRQGIEIHSCIINGGFQSDVILETALMDMYIKCESMDNARKVFDEMHHKNVVSWTAMITAYAQTGHSEEAIKLFQSLDLEGIQADKITFAGAVVACASLQAVELGRIIHHERIVNEQHIGPDVILDNNLMNMYSKCGCVEDARKVFDKMPEKNVISWTTMVAAYAENGQGQTALQLFQNMDLEGVKVNDITLTSALEACASSAALAEGLHIHARVVDAGYMPDDLVATALVNMYGGCGRLEDARLMFDSMPQESAALWNAMLGSYARNGYSNEALELFYSLILEGIKPNEVTFTSTLLACSHAGLLEKGYDFFMGMSLDHGITPVEGHYSCMVDVLGRAGSLDGAEDLVNSMPFQPNAVVWTTLLGGCRVHGDIHRGARAAERAFVLDPASPVSYVLLSNIYAAAGKCRKLSEGRGLKKQPAGMSFVSNK